jgi:hypothetical protein
VVREWVGAGGEMTQALYAHMNNKKINKFKKISCSLIIPLLMAYYYELGGIYFGAHILLIWVIFLS